MAKTDYKSIDEYLATQSEATRAILQRVRNTIGTALPEAAEVISYQIPAYRQHGGVVVYFAGWKEHYSIYPVSPKVVATFTDELARYDLSKGTIRFPLSEPVPVELIAGIVTVLADEAADRAKVKRPAQKKR